MKKFILTVLLLFFTIANINNDASAASLVSVVGEIVYEAKGDYYIAKTEKYYVLLEHYSGPALYEGNIIIGNLHSYGFKDIIKDGNDTHVRIYIEHYWADPNRCLDWLDSHGKLK